MNPGRYAPGTAAVEYLLPLEWRQDERFGERTSAGCAAGPRPGREAVPPNGTLPLRKAGFSPYCPQTSMGAGPRVQSGPGAVASWPEPARTTSFTAPGTADRTGRGQGSAAWWVSVGWRPRPGVTADPRLRQDARHAAARVHWR